MLTTIGIIAGGCVPVYQDFLNSTSDGPRVNGPTCRTYSITTTYYYETRDIACGTASTYYQTSATNSYTDDSTTTAVNGDCQNMGPGEVQYRDVYLYCDGTIAGTGPWKPTQSGTCYL
jgi:hypothetical protein